LNNTVKDNVAINQSLTTVSSGGFSDEKFGNQTNFANLGKREIEFRADKNKDRIPEDSGQNTDSFTAELVLDEIVQQVNWYDFAVRYQALTAFPDNGNDDDDKDKEGSGAGRAIPTPALLPGLLGLAAGAVRKKQQANAN
jgi:hypothetical protein